MTNISKLTFFDDRYSHVPHMFRFDTDFYPRNKGIKQSNIEKEIHIEQTYTLTLFRDPGTTGY